MRYALLILIVLSMAACDEPQPAQSNEIDVQEIAVSGEATITEVSPSQVRHSTGGESYKRTVYIGPQLSMTDPSAGTVIGGVKAFESRSDSSVTVEETADGMKITKREKTDMQGGEMEGEGLFARLWRVLRNIIIGWLVAVVVAVVLALIPATAPIGALLLKLLVSPIPGVGAAVMAWLGSRKVKESEERTRQVVVGVQNGRQELSTEDRDKFDVQLKNARDDATKKKVAAIKSDMR